MHTLGIDLGGTNIKVGLLDPAGQLFAQTSAPTEAARGPEFILSRMVERGRALIASASLQPGSVRAVGLGMPGPMSQSRGIVFECANLPGWHNFPIRDRLSECLQLPAILENDANAAAYGEFVAGAGRGFEDVVMLTLGTGVGGGVILGGRLVQGAMENAGEIGHMIIEPGGRPCPCGQRGCLERYSSASAVAERLAEAVAAGRESKLADAVRAGREITSRDVAQASLDGDALSHEVWDDACRRLAIAIVTIQHLFNPAIVLLGGGMSNAGEPLMQRVRSHFAQETWRLLKDYPRIEFARLGETAGMIGAAALARSAV